MNKLWELIKSYWDKQVYPLELKKRAARRKRLELIIDESMKNVTNKIRITEPVIFQQFYYGAIDIDPKYLVVWYIFRTDFELKMAEENGLVDELRTLLKSELNINGYPQNVISIIHISFATDEDIQKETGGNYWQYFK